jgi:clusterin-associated protein 1
VKELLKIATLLYQATARADEDVDEQAGAEFNLSAKAFDVKLTRQLASEITQRGAAMYDALGQESALREDRLRAISRNMDIEDIEQQVHEQISTVQENVKSVERMLGNLEKDEKSLEGKIEKRRNELERSEKSLSTLQSVRPAYMDEYDQLQAGGAAATIRRDTTSNPPHP